jgi:hypothetical protein
MKTRLHLFAILILVLFVCGRGQSTDSVVSESIIQTIKIDSVWAGHPVGFCLYTHGDRQYIAYYNSDRNMVVGQRNLGENNFSLHVLRPTRRIFNRGTSTVLGWDSHNYVTIGIDRQGFIHLSGNIHVHPLTYFRSTAPHDISTLEQVFEMVGTQEKQTTYPRFMLTKEGEILFHYRDGRSGKGNEIYNIYSCETKTWSRLLDVPLTDGRGLMNAYQTQPTVMKDGWYHVYWVWRDTPDCRTNHDLSYMKSPDLKKWYNAFGEEIELPATPDKKSLVVDPIPVNGGIINLAAELCLDGSNRPVFAYHKYDAAGNLQVYTAQIKDDQWRYRQVTDWDYRWEFSGFGSINVEVRIKGFKKRNDGMYEIEYWHIKYGNGAILLNDKFEPVGEVSKIPFEESLIIEGTFPGLGVRTKVDLGKSQSENTRYLLKWETLGRNRDRPRKKPWPPPSQLYLYKLKKN